MNKLSDTENANLDTILQSWKATVQLDHNLSDKVWSKIQTPPNHITFAQVFYSLFTSPLKLVPVAAAVICSGGGLAQYQIEVEEEKRRHAASFFYLESIYAGDIHTNLMN